MPELTTQKDRFIKLPLGSSDKASRTIVIDREEYSIDRMERMHYAILEIRDKYAIENRYPKEQVVDRDEEGLEKLDEDGQPLMREETNIEWLTRVNKLVDNKYARNDGESQEDHLRRVHELNMQQSTAAMAFDIVSRACEIFNLGSLSKEEFKKAPYGKTKDFLWSLLSEGDITFGDRFRRSEG